MAKSNTLEELRIKLAPYFRSTIIGEQNRVGHGAFYGGKLSELEDTYVLNGKTTTITADIEKDFFKVTSFVEKFLKKEIGGANKTDYTLDSLIGEILHILKYNEISSENNSKYISQNDILNDAEFSQTQQAFLRIEKRGELSQTMRNSSVEGLSDVVRDGRFGELKNDILSTEADIYSVQGRFSSQEIAKKETEVQIKREEAIFIQEQKKEEASQILRKDPQKVKMLKERCSALRKITRENEKGCEAYENAIAEIRQIIENNKEIFDNDKKINKAIQEIKELNKPHINAKNLETEQIQPEA